MILKAESLSFKNHPKILNLRRLSQNFGKNSDDQKFNNFKYNYADEKRAKTVNIPRWDFGMVPRS